MLLFVLFVLNNLSSINVITVGYVTEKYYIHTFEFELRDVMDVYYFFSKQLHGHTLKYLECI